MRTTRRAPLWMACIAAISAGLAAVVQAGWGGSCWRRSPARRLRKRDVLGWAAELTSKAIAGGRLAITPIPGHTSVPIPIHINRSGGLGAGGRLGKQHGGG
jgi:hypothetical protein